MQKYYDLLELKYPATPEQLKKAFHRLAHIYHPDKQTGDVEKFKKILQAYQILTGKENVPQNITQHPFYPNTNYRVHVTYAGTQSNTYTVYDPISQTWITVRW